MTTIVEQINDIVEHLHEPEQILVLEIVKRFMPDDVATDDDLEAIALAREEFAKGETVNYKDIDWE